MESKIKSIFDFVKKHIVVFAYFIFLVLALLPTMIESMQKLGVPYKAGVLLLFAAFIVVYLIKKKIKLEYKWLIIPVIVLAVFSLYYLFVIPTYFSYTAPEYSFIYGVSVTVNTTFKMRLTSVMDVFNICFFATLFLLVTPKLGLNKTDLLVFISLVCVLVFVACLLSIKELKNNYDPDIGLHSFLSNKNTFGEFLMVGVLLSLFGFRLFKSEFLKIAAFLLTIIFSVFVILSGSSTPAVLSALYIIIGAILILFGLKIKTKWKILFFVVLGLLFAFILASPYIPKISNNKASELLRDIYDKIFRDKDNDFDNLFSGRGKLWHFGADMVNGKYVMLGYGSATMSEIVFRATVNYFTTSVLTNVYLEVLNMYGVIGSLFYLGVIVYLFLVYFKSKNKLSWFLFVFLIVYIFYGIFESLVLFRSFSGSLLMTPILVVPAGYLKEGVVFLKRKEVVESEQF